jgi:TonB family protein
MIIDEDGCVREAKVLQSTQKKLGAAALEAVRQWVYQPIKVDGKPVRVLNFVTFNFNGRG